MTVRELLPTRAKDEMHALLWDCESRAFHGDRIYRAVVCELIEGLGCSGFVETGTYLSDSSGYVALTHPHLTAYTCELNPSFPRRATQRLRGLDNVVFAAHSSEVFVRAIITLLEGQPPPLFFLDAHWNGYWPPADEIRAIASSQLPAVMVIDDFEIPGRPEFGFDVEGGTSELRDGYKRTSRVCGLKLVAEHLDPSNAYELLLPIYEKRDAFPTSDGSQLRGHALIFQNLREESRERIASNRLINANYSRKTIPFRSSELIRIFSVPPPKKGGTPCDQRERQQKAGPNPLSAVP